MRRRTFLKTISSAFLLATASLKQAMAFSRPKVSFRHGVASGDPTGSSVIIWTRVSSAFSDNLDVRWQIANDAAMQDIVTQGHIETGAFRDFTVKVDVTGLAPGRNYCYRFICNGQESVVGSTRTLPQNTPRMARFAVVSCSSYPTGFFNAYRDIAERDDLDLVLHLGDYIYEYGLGQYGTQNATALGRVPEPAEEILSLADYRSRHAQYKTDVDLQAMHAKLPMLAIWDDHEFANDAWKNGAENHSPDEGGWAERRDGALQAYFEWMPVRGEPEGPNTRIFRDFRFGGLASILLLDTRLFGRDRQPNVGGDVTVESITKALQDPARRLLGADQEAWLRERLQGSVDTTWQVIAQQVMVARMEPPNLEPLVDREKPSLFNADQLDRAIQNSQYHSPQILDVWDGYPVAKEDFLSDLGNFAKNPVVLSGDLHTALAANLVPSSGGAPVAVELMTTSVTSPGLSAYFPDRIPDGIRDATLAQNPNFHFLDIEQHGWLCVTLTAEECVGEWHMVDTISSRDYASSIAKRLSVQAGGVAKGLA